MDNTFIEIPKPVARAIRTNLDLVFTRKLEFSSETQATIDSLGVDSLVWETVGKHQDLESGFHNGYHKLATLVRNDDNSLEVLNTDENHTFNSSVLEEIFDSVWAEFLKIDPEAKLISYTRGLIDFSHNRGNMRSATRHLDTFGMNRWSFLVHLRGTSGGTVFYDYEVSDEVVKKVDFCPGQLIIFPSSYNHQGLLPTDENDRFIMNFILHVDTKLNDRVFDASPDMVKKSIQALKE